MESTSRERKKGEKTEEKEEESALSKTKWLHESQTESKTTNGYNCLG